MTIRRTYYCDSPDCGGSWSESAQRQLRNPTVTWGSKTLHFCDWDCILRYGATIPPSEVIPCGPGDEPAQP